MITSINVRKIIRDRIKKDTEKQKSTKEKKENTATHWKYKDDFGKFIHIGRQYNGHTVSGIVQATKVEEGSRTIAKSVGSYAAINKDKKIIRTDGRLTGMKYNEFSQNYKFEIVELASIKAKGE